MARKYGKAAQSEIEKEMRRYKRGKAHSGRGLKTVKNRKQAIAIGLSKARKKGAKVPKRSTRTRTTRTRTTRTRRARTRR